MRELFLLALLVPLLSAPALARDLVPFAEAVAPGTILIRTTERRLYLVRPDGTAWRYPVAVGRPGKQWFGAARIDGKHVEPDWAPPEEVRRDNPRLPAVIAGGAPNNPMARGPSPSTGRKSRSTARTGRARSGPSRPMGASGC
jgi:lipoprotein-anchoring transpeptidase ErfK/SrfK